MAWQTIVNKEQLSIVYDDERNHVLLEVNSGGYQPKFVTLHLNKELLNELIQDLNKAGTYIR